MALNYGKNSTSIFINKKPSTNCKGFFIDVLNLIIRLRLQHPQQFLKFQL